MLRKLLRPRLWWLLVFSLTFYLTREAVIMQRQYMGNGVTVGKYVHISFYEFEKGNEEEPYELLEYHVFTGDVSPDVYKVVLFTVNACLVIGCLSVGKELFLNKGKN